MSVAKHTPGPWRLRALDGAERYRVVDATDMPDQETVAVVEFHDDNDGETRANARLIAAAPVTAAQAMAFTYTVERFMRAGDSSDPRVPPTESEVADAMYALRAHIAKATGGS